MTFRTVFLASKACALCLQTAASGLASSRRCSTVPQLEACKVWQAFCKAVALPGCDQRLLAMPALMAEIKPFPETGLLAEQVALALQADAHAEHLRSQRAVAAEKAEEVRAQIRAKQQGGPSNSAAAEELCRSSAEAIKHYVGFRMGLDEAKRRLETVQVERQQRLQEAILQEREAALEAPLQAVREAETDKHQVEVEEEIRGLEENRRQILQELEATSTKLAQARDSRMALLQQHGEVTAKYRQRTTQLESELQDLRPSSFYKVSSLRASSMTEGELVAALKRSTERWGQLQSRFATAGKERAQNVLAELKKDEEAVAMQAGELLQKHAQLELLCFEAAGREVGEAVGSLLDVARARADLMARGLSAELEDVYSIAAAPRRRDMKQLRSALAVVESAFQEASTLWDSSESASGPVAKAKADQAAAVVPQLEAARGRIAQCLGELERADPDLYDLAMLAADEDVGEFIAASSASSGLPHGWEALSAEDGAVYYHNLVSGTTQWEVPAQDAAVCAGWRLFQADDGGWFYHNPYDGHGIWWPELPTYPAAPDSLDSLRKENVRQLLVVAACPARRTLTRIGGGATAEKTRCILGTVQNRWKVVLWADEDILSGRELTAPGSDCVLKEQVDFGSEPAPLGDARPPPSTCRDRRRMKKEHKAPTRPSRRCRAESDVEEAWPWPTREGFCDRSNVAKLMTEEKREWSGPEKRTKVWNYVGDFSCAGKPNMGEATGVGPVHPDPRAGKKWSEASQLAIYESDLWKKSCRNSAYLCKEIHYNTLAREWRCIWSEEDQKRSLTELQRVLEDVAVPALRRVPGLLGVQRIVCGCKKEFKIICKLGLDAFEDWSGQQFFPEEEMVHRWQAIEGVSKIEVQTFSLEPVFGAGK
ncbi:unnamed protein product [Symbiodinium sp. KB8]|nr:unnamed protein product [Symbiodinium sp. KB8]